MIATGMTVSNKDLRKSANSKWKESAVYVTISINASGSGCMFQVVLYIE